MLSMNNHLSTWSILGKNPTGVGLDHTGERISPSSGNNLVKEGGVKKQLAFKVFVVVVVIFFFFWAIS